MNGTDGEEVRILIVEDDGIIALDIMTRLEDLGYRNVSAAATGEDAIRVAERMHPHLVFMDITLRGDMDGIEAAEIIRDRLGTPVVFVTAYSDSSIRDRAAAASPAGYILKPFTTGDLASAVRRALRSP